MQLQQERLLSFIAAVSLLPATILLSGYFTLAGPTLTNVQIAPIARVRSTSLEMDGGRIRIWLDTQAPPPGAVAGRTIHWSERIEFPDVKRCFLEFDYHSLNLMPKKKGSTAYIIAFPIWCALLPFLIAPFLWLRKRRHPKVRVGFPVIS